MYGFVNICVREFIRAELGEKAWLIVLSESSLLDDNFQEALNYPDEDTYALISSYSTVGGLSQETALESLGRFFIQYASNSQFASILDATGKDTFTTLIGLNGMHDAIAKTLPGLRPPTFACTQVTDRSLQFHYRSHRPGLEPFVKGLILGLAERFKQNIRCQLLFVKSQERDHSLFLVELLDNGRTQ